jgi:hypothetical protein
VARGVLQAAASAEGLVLDRVVDPHSEPRTISHVLLENLGSMAERDDDVSDSVLGQPSELMLDDRPASDLDHGLRAIIGERSKSLSLASGEDQGLSDPRTAVGQLHHGEP